VLREERCHRSEKEERARGAGHSNEFHVVASISMVGFPVLCLMTCARGWPCHATAAGFGSASRGGSGTGLGCR
jgi:hypothetical protein